MKSSPLPRYRLSLKDPDDVIRSCSECGRKLNRYNKSATCFTCHTKTFDIPSLYDQAVGIVERCQVKDYRPTKEELKILKQVATRITEFQRHHGVEVSKYMKVILGIK